MNEQIKQLAVQAFRETALYGGKRGDKDFDQRYDEKFAELIVKECAMYVEGFKLTQEVALDEYVDFEASEVLKEHFGVEE